MRNLFLSSAVVATVLTLVNGFHSSPLISLNQLRNTIHQRAKANAEEIYDGEDFLSVLTNIDKRNSKASSYSQSPLTEVGRNDESRRMFLSSVLMSASIAIYPHDAEALPEPSTIPWTASPINKRTGIVLNQAESVYDLRFVTYLSRFLLSFDKECQKWWYRRGAVDIPSTSTAEQVKEIRLKHFAMFSASVEVGLQEFLDLKNDNIENMSNLGNNSGGPKVLMKSLVDRYGGGIGFVGSGPKSSDYLVDEKTMSDDERLRRKREVKEARRQIALLFGLMKNNQPTEMMTQLLAAIDDGKVDRVEILNPGRGYAPGYGPPRVHFPDPEVYESGKIAKGRAILRPSSRLLRIDVDIKNRGKGYTKPPMVTISPPNLSTYKGAESRAATAEATVFKSGENKGRIESVQIIDPGYGYTEDDQIQVTIAPPSTPLIKVDSASSDADTSKTCLAKAVLEYEVGSIEIIDPGEGYATEKPLDLVIDEPPPTAGLNMLDPLVVKKFRLNVDEFAGSQDMSKTLLNLRGKFSESAKARAFCVAETNSYKSFRKANDNQAIVFEKALLKQKIQAKGDENSNTPMPFWTGGTSNTSPQLLSLLPSGIGLLYNNELKRYDIVAGDDILDYDWKDSVSPGKPLNPMFGPRGRSPIEREKEVDLSTLLRFYLAGAICCSTVHLVLTPIDVVKTNMQTKPDLYPDPFTSFKKISEDSGVKGFFAGWAPTFLGFFINGGVVYTCIEFFRRFYTEIAGDLASSYEVPIILLSSFTAAVIGAFTLTPSEAIRIRSVAQPDYASDVFGVARRMIDEEGLNGLFNALPAFLLKEIPFTVAKFTVFDLSTEYLYQQFPAAVEDIKLSLLVSLAGGTLGGICAAVVSNPADATISQMKKAKSDDGPLVTFQKLANEGGTKALFRGLGVRMFFYTLIVALQFLVYDAIRISFGIGNDDLKLYLDVLGGALKESGGPN